MKKSICIELALELDVESNNEFHDIIEKIKEQIKNVPKVEGVFGGNIQHVWDTNK